jgi:hypothetical protein
VCAFGPYREEWTTNPPPPPPSRVCAPVQWGVDDHPLLGTSAPQPPLPPTPLARAAQQAAAHALALALGPGASAGPAGVAHALAAKAELAAKQEAQTNPAVSADPKAVQVGRERGGVVTAGAGVP